MASAMTFVLNRMSSTPMDSFGMWQQLSSPSRITPNATAFLKARA